MQDDDQLESNATEAVYFLKEVTNIIGSWIHNAEADRQHPVVRHSSTQQLREEVKLELPDDGRSREEVLLAMSNILANSVNPWTGRFVDKLYTAPMPMGIASEALLAAINANAHVMTAAPMLCLAEEACVKELTALCNWNVDLADGFAMPGGSASNTIAIQTALLNRFPVFKDQGIVGVVEQISKENGRTASSSRPLILTGSQGHYSLQKAAIACGLGLNCVVSVACNRDGTMSVDALKQTLESSEMTGGVPFFVNATAGSTVLGSFDNLEAIAKVCQHHNVWLHCDGSWGGPVLFSKKYRSKMNGIEQFDSLTINPHKLLNVPHQCSFIVFKNGDVLSSNALDAPYLFHDDEDTQSNGVNADTKIILRKAQRRNNPAVMTFGCGRKGDALKFYLAWLAKGEKGFGEIVENGIELAKSVVKYAQSTSHLRAAIQVHTGIDSDEKQFLQVCLRPRIDDSASTEQRSKATQWVHQSIRQGRKFAVDYAPLDNDGDYIRIVTHASAGEANLFALVDEIAALGGKIQERMQL